MLSITALDFPAWIPKSDVPVAADGVRHHKDDAVVRQRRLRPDIQPAGLAHDILAAPLRIGDTATIVKPRRTGRDRWSGKHRQWVADIVTGVKSRVGTRLILRDEVVTPDKSVARAALVFRKQLLQPGCGRDADAWGDVGEAGSAGVEEEGTDEAVDVEAVEGGGVDEAGVADGGMGGAGLDFGEEGVVSLQVGAEVRRGRASYGI